MKNTLYFSVENVCRVVDESFAEKFLQNGKKPTRIPEITHSEILTIILLYQQSRCKDFKSFYTRYVKALSLSEFLAIIQ
ncbi:MAG: hypothetical protein PG981_000497 [Wolbachia endosymbiont of Ctenocephalides orientis wCori]|nr:MAG: hypothetical protein PG981_000497 [Wolbachia endosymbiont of Ctenocephalides orientis wCori]